MKEKPFNLVLKYEKTVERYYGRTEMKFEKEIKLTDFDVVFSKILEELKVNENDCELDVRFTK